jgi:hypothetical protein
MLGSKNIFKTMTLVYYLKRGDENPVKPNIYQCFGFCGTIYSWA